MIQFRKVVGFGRRCDCAQFNPSCLVYEKTADILVSPSRPTICSLRLKFDRMPLTPATNDDLSTHHRQNSDGTTIVHALYANR